MTWIKIFIFSILLVSVYTADKELTRPTKKDDVITKPSSSLTNSGTSINRDKRNFEYGISHSTYPRDARLERRISNTPPVRMYPAFFPSGTRPYTYYRKPKPQLPPYAVQMEPLTLYSQRDPLYDPNSLSSLPQPHNELTKPDDQTTDNNHLSENYYGPPKQYIERPVYIKEPEPIIEIIIKEANTTAPTPHHQEVVTLPPKKKKEEVQVFYVKYKKNPHGTGKDSVIYDKPIPAISPIQDNHEEEHNHEETQPEHLHTDYAEPTYAPPVATTTIRAIIKPDSETYHADSGIHVTFGGASHNPHAETYSHDDDIVESAPQPALSHPEGRRFPSSHNSNPTTTTFTQEYKPEQRLPQPYRPFNFNTHNNANQRPPNFQQALPTFNNNHNFNVPPSTLSNLNNQQIFNNPVPNRFSSATSFPRPNFTPVIKQGPPLPNVKPYQFERPQQFQFPRQPTHFPIQQPNSGGFNHKPNFPIQTVTKFSQPSQHSFQLSQQQQPQGHHPQQVFHQGPNSFSFQTHFAEPSGFNNNNHNLQLQNDPQILQQTYHTIPQNRPTNQFNQQQQQVHNHQKQQTSQQSPLPLQSNSNIHSPVQSLPLIQNFNQQQFTSNNQHNFQSQQQNQPQPQVHHQQTQQQHHQHHQQQIHQQQQQNTHHHQPQEIEQHKHFIPPGGELIPALPKYEQHISIPSAPADTLSQLNFSTQIQQQFRDFTQQQQQSQQNNHHQQQPQQNHHQQQHLQENHHQHQQPQENHHQQQSQQIQIHQQHQQIQNHNFDNTNHQQPIHNNNYQSQKSNTQNHNFQTQTQFNNDFNPNQNYFKYSTQSTTPSPQTYVTNPRPSSTTRHFSTTTTTTTTTTPKPESTTLNLKDLNIELPDEVPDDLREQLLSSGILKNAHISVLDYDKVGDIPISALPPDQLANFYSAGGAQQIASGSETKPTILHPDGSPIQSESSATSNLEDDIEPIAEASTMEEIRAKPSEAVEMKVVRYDPETPQGQQLHDSYVKEGATQIEPVVLNDQSYNRYLPLKVSGAKFPIPEIPELKGKNINSVVVLAPVDYNFYKQRVVRDANANLDDDIQLIKNEALKKLVKDPSRENYKKFLDHEKSTASDQQSVILLVTGSKPENREIFMYDVGTMSVSKLDGELSAAFVDAAETNTSEEEEKEKGSVQVQASNRIETKVPAPEGLNFAQEKSSFDDDIELQPAASDVYETRVPIIDPMQGDLEAEGSEQLEQFVDISGLQRSDDNEDLMSAASNDNSKLILINSGYSKTEHQLPSL